MSIFRLVNAKLGTYAEIQDYWTFEMIMDGHEFLDIKEDIAFTSLQQSKNKG